MTPACNIHTGDALAVLRTMPSESVHCVVTSPPYWNLRDYALGRSALLIELNPAYIDLIKRRTQSPGLFLPT